MTARAAADDVGKERAAGDVLRKHVAGRANDRQKSSGFTRARE
jgi:hypothetical protein